MILHASDIVWVEWGKCDQTIYCYQANVLWIHDWFNGKYDVMVSAHCVEFLLDVCNNGWNIRHIENLDCNISKFVIRTVLDNVLMPLYTWASAGVVTT